MSSDTALCNVYIITVVHCLYFSSLSLLRTALRVLRRLADSIIGHLPREISRPTRFFLLRGGVAVAEVINTTHRRSPLVQGGLEIPVKVAVEIEATAKN